MQKTKITSLFLVLAILFSMLVFSASGAYENNYRNTGNQRVDIVEVAKTQIGNSNSGRKYRNDNLSWCASFVVWCARQAEISSSIIRIISLKKRGLPHFCGRPRFFGQVF